jgi:hypothetical protein
MSFSENNLDQRPLIKVFVFLFLLLIFLPASAANHYVRQGATGNGSDWTNACGDFTGSCAVSSLVRGDTYYVGAGSYTSKTWNTPDSGTLVITIKKATTADHGTDTGWNSAYAAQATFTERNDIETDYWVFDGQVGDYATGGIGSYGFKEQYSVGDYAGCGSSGGTTGAGFLLCGSNVTIRYVDCSGYAGTGDYNYPGQAKCIEAYQGNNWTVSHVAMHGCESCLQGGQNNWVVEYSYMYNSRSISTNFHNNIYYLGGGSGGIFRYNKAWDYNSEGVFLTEGPLSNIYIYGNVFASDGTQSGYPRGVELRQDFSYTNVFMYNNTFYNLNDGAINDLTGSTGNTCTGCYAWNNLAVLTGYSFSASAVNQSNNVSDSTTSRFLSVSPLYTADFHLKSATTNGSTLSSTLPASCTVGVNCYNIDPDGKTRGADGTWDVGAYEYGGSAQPGPPTGLQFQVQ